MMRKILLIIIGLLIAGCSYSQEHISFNGATFGKTVKKFAKELNGMKHLERMKNREEGWDPSLCNSYRCGITLNSKYWVCDIRSSIVSNTVWETISVCESDYPRDDMMFLVKALQEKYGSPAEEKKEDLGRIGYLSYYCKEMMAFRFYVKNSSNKVIGEVRISVAPYNGGGKRGYIELSYRDMNALAVAQKEYDSVMKGSL